MEICSTTSARVHGIIISVIQAVLYLHCSCAGRLFSNDQYTLLLFATVLIVRTTFWNASDATSIQKIFYNWEPSSE